MKSFVMAAVGWLAAMALLAQSGPVGSAPVLFASGYLLGFACMALAVRHCPRQWSLSRVAAAVIALGLLGRMLFLWSFPAGNDTYRYIWEGYIQLHGFNPYQMAPGDPALAHLIQGDMASIWPFINHKDLSAAYPPLVMLLFKGLAALSPTPALFKGAVLAFDLLTLGILVWLVRWQRLPGAHLFWYALNPLVLVYVAGEGHLDSVQAAFLMLGLFGFCARKPLAGFLALGAAVVSKYFAAVALPFVMQRANRRAWPAAAAALLFFLPFADAPKALFGSLFVFGTQMHYNDGLAEVLRFFLGNAALPALALLLMGLLAAIYVFEHDRLRSVYLALGAVLVCLPTLHPWYLLLIAPFMAIYPSRAWLYLMAATVITLPVLVYEVQTGIFQEIKWLKWFEYIPFFSILIYDFLKPGPRPPKAAFPAPQTVTAILPALNEAKHIRQAIQAASAEPEIVQVVVVDGGSEDDTPTLARKAGAEVLSGPRGRGCQVAVGLTVATGDVILVLHADTRLSPGAAGRMLQALKAAPAIPGGAFEMVFESASWKLKWIATLNNWRARYVGIAFGDQGQFFRRSVLETMEGFPDLRLMEDVELSLRLKRFGRPLLVRNGVRVSPRRWAEGDFTGNVWKVMSLFVRYPVERRFYGPDDIRTDYYGKYYGRP